MQRSPLFSLFFFSLNIQSLVPIPALSDTQLGTSVSQESLMTLATGFSRKEFSGKLRLDHPETAQLLYSRSVDPSVMGLPSFSWIRLLLLY
jgi:hypothetical protein